MLESLPALEEVGPRGRGDEGESRGEGGSAAAGRLARVLRLAVLEYTSPRHWLRGVRSLCAPVELRGGTTPLASSESGCEAQGARVWVRRPRATLHAEYRASRSGAGGALWVKGSGRRARRRRRQREAAARPRLDLIVHGRLRQYSQAAATTEAQQSEQDTERDAGEEE